VGVPAGGSRLPASFETVKRRQHYMKMKGNELFKKAVKAMVKAIEISLFLIPSEVILPFPLFEMRELFGMDPLSMIIL